MEAPKIANLLVDFAGLRRSIKKNAAGEYPAGGRTVQRASLKQDDLPPEAATIYIEASVACAAGVSGRVPGLVMTALRSVLVNQRRDVPANGIVDREAHARRPFEGEGDGSLRVSKSKGLRDAGSSTDNFEWISSPLSPCYCLLNRMAL
jgi:hypothetical protein